MNCNMYCKRKKKPCIDDAVDDEDDDKYIVKKANAQKT